MTATLASESVLREFCTYLGFDGAIPIGEMRGGSFGGYDLARRTADASTADQPDTLVRELVEALHPLYTAPGESMHDGRLGRQGTIEALLRDWPHLPRYDHEIGEALGGREWLSQGSDWEYLDIRGRAVYEALMGGESAESVRARVLAADPALVSDHRAARKGDKTRPVDSL